MNRQQFTLLGWTGLLLPVPYAVSLFSGELRTQYPVVFFFIVAMALAGIMIGILYLMFHLEYRGIWFSKNDPAKPLKFEESDLPRIKELGTAFFEQLRPFVLYSWDMVLRPVLLPDGSRVYNLRFDFAASDNAPFSLAGETLKLKKGKCFTFNLRARMNSGKIEIPEFRTGRKNALVSPANKKISPLNLKGSEKLAECVSSLLKEYEFDWQIAEAVFHRTRHPYLQIRINLYSGKAVAIRIGNDEVSCRAERRESISFRLTPELEYAGGLKRLSLAGKLLSAR